MVAEKNLLFSVDKTYQLYHLFLSLITDVRQYAERRIEIGRQKMLPTPEDLNPNMKFVENRIVEQIAGSDNLLTFLTANKLSWSNYPEVIKKIYNNMVDSDYYKDYMNSPENSYEADKQFVIDFYTNEIEDLDEVYEAVEEQSIYWADDIGFALIMVVKTVKNMRESDAEVRLLPQFKNDDDRAFAKELLRHAMVNHKVYLDMIDANTKNWDIERIAFMDRMIMLATISELVACPTIPVKVTLDEYIEISKYYSTPASGTFINGVLDKVVEQLKKDGKIEKQGRGLVEN